MTLSISIDNEPAGQLVIGLYGDAAPLAAQRFADLSRVVKARTTLIPDSAERSRARCPNCISIVSPCKQQQGVGYRRSAFEFISGGVIRNSGVRSFVRGEAVDVGRLIAGGDSAEELQRIFDQEPARLKHTGALDVSLVVRRPPGFVARTRERLVAKGGSLVNVVEELDGPGPNGTSWEIVTPGAALEALDETNLVVGRVVEGAELVAKLLALPINEFNTENPFFKVGKQIGDSRGKWSLLAATFEVCFVLQDRPSLHRTLCIREASHPPICPILLTNRMRSHGGGEKQRSPICESCGDGVQRGPSRCMKLTGYSYSIPD